MHRLLDANIDALSGHDTTGTASRRPIFLDMQVNDGAVLLKSQFGEVTARIIAQAINDLEIAAGGLWGNYTLVPWGLVYLVMILLTALCHMC